MKETRYLEVLRARFGGTDLDQCDVMLADMADWPAFNNVYCDFFKTPYPARSAFGANGLALGSRLEIDVIATTGQAA